MFFYNSSLYYIFKNWLNAQKSSNVLYDRLLLWLTLVLICIGLTMVISSSISISTRLLNDPFYFTKRSILNIGLVFCISLVVLQVPILIWYRLSSVILFIVFLMLFVTLVIGKNVNGSSRWILLGPISIQPAELSKLSLFLYLSGYLARNIKEVQVKFWSFLKPISIMFILSLLILFQPDFGTVIIIFITTLIMLFIAGVKLWQICFVLFFTVLILIWFIISKPYRMQRMISFLDPWQDPFGSGYQLTQSLMAFGRGKLFGQGLGNSIQKLEYLPESHTDFIFSIIGEELGCLGTLFVLLVLFLISFRALYISQCALKMNQYFSSFLSCAIGTWLSIQTLINVGSSTGLLPTKGLTLPLISYGGSSFIITSIAIMLLLRIDFELRIINIQAFIK